MEINALLKNQKIEEGMTREVKKHLKTLKHMRQRQSISKREVYGSKNLY